MRLDVSPHAPVDVLIADDDAQLRSSVRLLLETQGFTCAEAMDGPQAVAVAHDLTPRCVLLDLGMPGLDGFSVARRLRADPRTAHAHVHCLTGHADPTSRREAEAAGCELFLTKPVDPVLVVAAAGGWTGLTHAAAEELLDWLEAHGYAPAAVSYEDGIGFSIRLRASFQIAPAPNRHDESISDDSPDCSRPGDARPVNRPSARRLARYTGTYQSRPVGHLVLRLPRVPALIACAVAACAGLASYWLGIVRVVDLGVLAAALGLILAIPHEERWLPFFPPSFKGDLVDGSVIEFDGVASKRGHYGHGGMMRRTVQIVRMVRSEPNRDDNSLSDGLQPG
jgi:CheY-like chemotaxis protein